MEFVVVDEGELFERELLFVVDGGAGGTGGDFIDEICRPSGVGELIRWIGLPLGKTFVVDFNAEDES